MKILLCTKRDLVGNMMLNRLLPALADRYQVEVLLANRIRPETAAVAELGWLKFFEQDLPNRLLFPLLDQRGGADNGSRWCSFDTLARRHGVPMQDAGHIARGAELTRRVEGVMPDLIVSFQFGFIFKPEALDVPRLGALNLHSGALPRHAGVNPTFWCMKDGEPEAACTLHWIDRGIDTGPLLEVRPMQLDYTRSLFSNWVDNYRNGAQMIEDAVHALGRGEQLPSTPQVDAERHYVPKPTPADFAALAERGVRLVDTDDYLALLAQYLPAQAPVPLAPAAAAA
ncbi:formyltransferase family protein [Herbaspirillum robiniae]|uniref:Formyl transferase N-terminal domain-containing protein n=1 Tax=Herbaspirillum robiniae TaxID=2014887 RepID=A0ABX2LXV2_9BURK|nr:formyltransferase family protein [Herbaspirillum robiniae]NUU03317.1 hypothetical protein [Herbaspirillum robiniae]